jgi:hypothetical protein
VNPLHRAVVRVTTADLRDVILFAVALLLIAVLFAVVVQVSSDHNVLGWIRMHGGGRIAGRNCCGGMMYR